MFTAFKRGDENLSWIEDAEGYSLVRNEETAFWEYALTAIRSGLIDGSMRYWLVLVPSGIAYQPNEAPPGGWPKNLRPSRKTSSYKSK